MPHRPDERSEPNDLLDSLQQLSISPILREPKSQSEEGIKPEAEGQGRDQIDESETLIAHARTLFQNFENGLTTADVDNAIALQRAAISCTLDSDPRKAKWLGDLGHLYTARAIHLNQLVDINYGIDSYTRAIELASDTQPERPVWFNSLASLHSHRFQHLCLPEDLDGAVNCSIQALSLASDDHAERSIYLTRLGGSYHSRFKHIGNIKDIDESIESYAAALSLTPQVHEYNTPRLEYLMASYLARFEVQGNVADVDKAIDCQHQVIRLNSDGHCELPERLKDMGTLYSTRFGVTDELSDIQKSVEYLSQANALIPSNDEQKPRYTFGLGIAFLSRFERSSEVSDINNAIDLLSLSASLSPNGHEAQVGCLRGLARAYSVSFEYQGNIEHVNEAINWYTSALLLTPDDSPEQPGLLCNLGTSYSRRFTHTGEVVDVDEAINYLRSGVPRVPNSDKMKSNHLNDFGTAYSHRFQRLGEIIDLNNAIECMVQAVSLSPTGSINYHHLLNLGGAYLQRFERFESVGDVHKAIDCIGFAASLIPDRHIKKLFALMNLGVAFLARFRRLSNLNDINNAIAVMTQAVSFTSDGQAARPQLLGNLGLAHLDRFKRQCEEERKEDDINDAVKCLEQAVAICPDSYAYKPLFLNNLGLAVYIRFHCLGTTHDLHRASSCFQHASESTVGAPQTKFKAACQWARMSVQHGLSPLLAYRRVMELLQQLVWLGTTVNQRYQLITQIGSIATEAAACAIEFKENDSAIEWLEEGRSIVWNQILQLRTPFDDLLAVAPALAMHLKQVGQELGLAGSRPPSLSVPPTGELDLENDAKRHRELASDWEDLLRQARLRPGFHNFLRPRKASELKRAARSGPVVVVNIHQTRCDALIFQPDSDKVYHVPLETLSGDKALNIREQLARIGHRGFKKANVPNQTKPEPTWGLLLESLWKDIVQPVFSFLGYTYKLDIKQKPHITWCTTGPLSFLPLHAAGCYDSSHLNAFDIAISSYTPTLGALLSASPHISNPLSGLLAIGQEYTKGFERLAFTAPELAAIKGEAKAIRYLQLDGHNATAESVLSAMKEYSWVHLACHAMQNTKDPSQSAFHLHDGNLTLSSITSQSFTNKGLAFLSACQTATGVEELPDEAVHLAAGMLMAGYPSVIATMWSIADVDGPEVARVVYADLLKDGNMDCEGAARALHKAVSHLRDKIGHESYQRWLPFIHIGL